MAMSMLDSALELAGAGLPVFPLEPNGKRPLADLAPRGVYSATTDPETIRAWWTEAPDANIGAAVGAAGLSVLDVDCKDGQPGMASLADLEREHGPLAVDYVVETPSGGLHYYVREQWANTVSSVAPGLDTRGPGGYVVAAGSIIDGVPYRVAEWSWGLLETVQPAPAPLSMRVRSTTLPPAIAMPEIPDAAPIMVERALGWLSNHPPAVSGAGGNAHTFTTACRVRDFGLSAVQAEEAMLSEWNDRCDPPWTVDELATIVGNAYRYARGLPRLDGSGQLPEAMREVIAKRRPRFTPLSYDDLRNLPAPKWLIPDLLPECGLSMLVGPWGSYKSFTALALALDLATGSDTLGLGNVSEPQPVLYIAGEGAFGLLKRIAAWCEHHGIEPPDADHLRIVPEMPQLCDAEELRAFEERQTRPALIVLDTLATAMTGLDENAAQDMGRVASALGVLRDHWRCNVLAVHHTGKNGTTRGSTVLPGAVDTILTTSLDDGKLSLTVTKQKDAEQRQLPAYEPRSIVTGHGTSLVMVATAPGKPDKSGKTEMREVVDGMLKEQAAALDDRTHEEILERVRATLAAGTQRTISVGALCRIVAADMQDDEGRIRTRLRTARMAHELRPHVAEMDARGRPQRFLTAMANLAPQEDAHT